MTNITISTLAMFPNAAIMRLDTQCQMWLHYAKLESSIHNDTIIAPKYESIQFNSNALSALQVLYRRLLHNAVA